MDISLVYKLIMFIFTGFTWFPAAVPRSRQNRCKYSWFTGKEIEPQNHSESAGSEARARIHAFTPWPSALFTQPRGLSLHHFQQGPPRQSGPAAVWSYVKLLNRTFLPSVHEKLAKAQCVGHCISLGPGVLSLYHTKVGELSVP